MALVPAVVPALTRAGLEVLLEAGAGEAAGFQDSEYREKGATIAGSRREIFEKAEILLVVRTAGASSDDPKADLQHLKKGQMLIGFCDPLGAPEGMKALAAKGVDVISMEMIPRITRAQSMDALSSMATIAGYKGVLVAAERFARIFPMLMTAAGTLAPAKVFVVGVGVAGLQAIATARRLGAVVEAYDIRPEVKEQVQSVGARFVELKIETEQAADTGGYAKEQKDTVLEDQQRAMGRVVAANDIVITTAAVPGKKAPVLITKEMVRAMSAGSVIVDLAAERGGNCELCRPGETVVEGEVTIIGPVNLPSTVPNHASQMYAKNISTLLLSMVKEGDLSLDLEDEVVASTLVVHNGEVRHPMAREALGLSASSVSIGSES